MTLVKWPLMQRSRHLWAQVPAAGGAREMEGGERGDGRGDNHAKTFSARATRTATSHRKTPSPVGLLAAVVPRFEKLSAESSSPITRILYCRPPRVYTPPQLLLPTAPSNPMSTILRTVQHSWRPPGRVVGGGHRCHRRLLRRQKPQSLGCEAGRAAPAHASKASEA